MTTAKKTSRKKAPAESVAANLRNSGYRTSGKIKIPVSNNESSEPVQQAFLQNANTTLARRKEEATTIQAKPVGFVAPRNSEISGLHLSEKSAKLLDFAPWEQYIVPYEEQDLGIGEFVSDTDAAIGIVREKGRENSAKVKMATSRADTAHINANTARIRVDNAMLNMAKVSIRNISLRDDVAYSAGRLRLKAEKNVRQLDGVQKEIQKISSELDIRDIKSRLLTPSATYSFTNININSSVNEKEGQEIK